MPRARSGTTNGSFRHLRLDRQHVFGLGFIEIGIVIGLGYFAFKHIIVRFYPGFNRAFDFVFYTAMALMVLFGVISQLR